MLPLHTPRLTIRRFTLDDIEQIHETYASHESGWPLAPGGVSADLDDTRRVVERILEVYETWGGLGPWAVETLEERFVVGDCGLFRSQDAWAQGELELGYRFRPASWGRGYATEAARAVLACAFEELGAPRVVADAEAANTASLRVLEKIGMRVVGGDGGILWYAADAPGQG